MSAPSPSREVHLSLCSFSSRGTGVIAAITEESERLAAAGFGGGEDVPAGQSVRNDAALDFGHFEKLFALESVERGPRYWQVTEHDFEFLSQLRLRQVAELLFESGNPIIEEIFSGWNRLGQHSLFESLRVLESLDFFGLFFFLK